MTRTVIVSARIAALASVAAILAGCGATHPAAVAIPLNEHIAAGIVEQWWRSTTPDTNTFTGKPDQLVRVTCARSSDAYHYTCEGVDRANAADPGITVDFTVACQHVGRGCLVHSNL